jgi:hypothetical protein
MSLLRFWVFSIGRPWEAVSRATQGGEYPYSDGEPRRQPPGSRWIVASSPIARWRATCTPSAVHDSSLVIGKVAAIDILELQLVTPNLLVAE